MSNSTWLVFVSLLVTACGNLVAPDLPTSASFAGLALNAELDVLASDPTEVRVRVLVTNQTSRAVEVGFLAPPCSVLPVVYGHVVSAFIGPEVGVTDCASIGAFLTLLPGETRPYPDQPQFVIRDWLGEKFEPGEYFISARVDVILDDAFENLELGTRTIEVR